MITYLLFFALVGYTENVSFFENRKDLVSKTHIKFNKLKKKEVLLKWDSKYDSNKDIEYLFGIDKLDTIIQLNSDYRQNRCSLKIKSTLIDSLKLKSYFNENVILGQSPTLFFYENEYYFEDNILGCNSKACEPFYIKVKF